jgi:hypothetical protein
MSMIPTCVVCDARVHPYAPNARCKRCEKPCQVCGGDLAHCQHPQVSNDARTQSRFTQLRSRERGGEARRPKGTAMTNIGVSVPELATKCCRAPGPDRVLNTEIARVLGHGIAYADGDRAWNFTGSLDAAATLIPTGMAWWLYDYGTSGAQASVAAATGDPDCPLKPGTSVRAFSKTPALALCAAALRARVQGHSS